MKKLILALILLVACPASVMAAIYHVAKSADGGNNSNSCSTAQTHTTGKLTIAAGIACMSTGDTLLIKQGTYAESIDISSLWGSTGSITWIGAYQTHVVVIKPTAGSGAIAGLYDAPTAAYFVFDDLDLDGGNNNSSSNITASSLYRSHHITIQGDDGGCQIHHWTNSGLQVFTDNVTVQDCEVHHNGVNIVSSTPQDHGLYVSGNNNLFLRNKIHTNLGYGIQQYDSNDFVASSNVYDSNEFYSCGGGAYGSGSPSLGAIILYHGTSGNIVRLNSITGCPYGIATGNGTNGIQIYNNSIEDVEVYAVDLFQSVNAIVKNNIHFGTGTSFSIAGSSGSTQSNNMFSGVDPLWINAAVRDFRLMVGSPAIDQGTSAIATGVTKAFNGSNPDIGAFERFTLTNCEVGGLATNRIVCNASMNLNQPIRITNTTGWTWTGGSLVSVVANGSAQLVFTLSGAYAGGASTITYVETTGNVTDSALIGNLLNQRMSAVTTMTVTDNTGGGPAGSVSLSHWRVYLLYGSADTAWSAKCAEDSTNCVVAPGSRVWVRAKLRNNSGSTYATFNLSTRWRYNAGSYAALTTSYVNGLRVLGTGTQLSTVLADGSTLTNDILTSNGTNVAGLAVRSASSIPSVALVDGSELEWAQAIDVSPSAVIGDVYEMCPYRDDGTALTCATPVKLTVGSFQGTR